MNNLLKYFALAGAVFLLLTAPAYALSCAPPTMSDAVYEGSAIIFQGSVSSKRELTRAEQEALTKQGLGTKGGDMSNVQAYEFTVSHGWKNATPGQKITILRNAYWGDGFATQSEYLIVARDFGGFFEAPLCGNSMPSEYADEQISFLKQHAAE